MFTEHLPGIAMRKPEYLLFDDMEWYVLLGGTPEAFSKVLGIQNRVRQKPEVVQQPGEVGLFGFWIFDFPRQSLGDKGTAERMPPERIRRDHPLVLRNNSIYAQPEQQRAYSLDPERHYRGAHSLDIAHSKERRICQAETLRRDGSVVRDKFNHFFKSDLVGRQSQNIEERLQDCGSRRDRVQLRDLGLQSGMQLGIHFLAPTACEAVGFQ